MRELRAGDRRETLLLLAEIHDLSLSAPQRASTDSFRTIQEPDVFSTSHRRYLERTISSAAFSRHSS
jgi:hypothetical protein